MLGAGIATGVTRVFLFVALLAIVLKYRLHEGAWTAWSKECLRLKGQLELLRLSSSLPAPAEPKLRSELATLAASMQGDYGKNKYCPPKPQGMFARFMT